MTTTSLHGSSSSLAFPTPSRNCKQGGGLLGCRGYRWRQMTMTSLHGSSSSSSFIDLKKGGKKLTPSRNCKRGGGLSSLSWVQTEADDDNEPTWLVVVVVVRCLKKRMKKPTPSRNCKRGGGLLGCRGCRRRQMTTTSMARGRPHRLLP